MDGPSFSGGRFLIKDHAGTEFVLHEETWTDHILGDRSRHYYGDNFDKIVRTIECPDRVLQSRKDVDVHVYEKRFADFYLFDNAIAGVVYNYVLVNVHDKKVLTTYPAHKRKNGQVLWQKEA